MASEELLSVIVVVVADDVEGIALEEVVVRIRLVATCRDGACGIELADDVGEAFCQEGIDTLLVAVGKCGGIVSEVEDEVSLFDGEFCAIVARPLFQHFVSCAPHQDAWMIAVAKDEVGEVALKPLVEVVGIVVLRL